jgi:catechol 2,3-dioxygenase-like lactoylglutathione lyase family enzyme
MPLETLRASVLGLRAFAPAKDIEESIAFYEALGFSTNRLGAELAEMTIAGRSFFLRNHGPAATADFFVMHLMVDDLDAWWKQLEELDAQGWFAKKPEPPALQSWGLRVAFFIDPTGVLWHVAAHPA